MAEQNIQLKNQNGDMLFPLTKWNNIESRPSKLPNPASLTLGDVVYDGTTTKVVETIEGGAVPIAQTTGTSMTDVMSQKAVTDEINALKKLIDDATYSPITITSFAVTPSIVEIGSTVTSVVLSWSLGGSAPTTLVVDGTTITDSTQTSLTRSRLSLKTNTTYSMSATDAKAATASKTATLSFLNRVHWGAASVPELYNSAFVLGLKNNALASSRNRTFSVTAGAGQYIYYTIPSSFGTPTFNVGGFDGGFTKVATFQHTNSSGAVAAYDVYQSDNPNLGTQTVRVS